ncbi:hypothetical protein [Segeticoccus rhizosphaerae]|jgi:hypothetical protein|uniref:hypothetical protein n=1 Tax=Segeticoccus rhizosphaerae TaxID=1104777 RepID=UPI0010C0163B|nr:MULTISPECIES: hypothetical protein [Intrasporangiaceae]
MTSSLISLVTAEEHTRELPMPSIVFGLISVGAFLVLLAFLWSFRNTAADHRPEASREHGQGEKH